jgi:hypothetical protein
MEGAYRVANAMHKQALLQQSTKLEQTKRVTEIKQGETTRKYDGKET